MTAPSFPVPPGTQIRIGRPTIRLSHPDGTETVTVCLPSDTHQARQRAGIRVGLGLLLLLAFLVGTQSAWAGGTLLAMASVIPIAFKKALFAGRAWKIAIYVGAANLSNATAGYTPVNEVVGGGYVAGGKSLVETVIEGSDGVTVLLDFENVGWPAASITGRYLLLYDNNAANKEGFVIDMGQDQQISGGTFTVEFPEPDLLTAMMAMV